MRVDWSSFLKKWTRPAPGQFPVGSRVYKGFQGSGKTLSVVKYAFDIVKAFPNCVIFSNVKIKGIQPLNFGFIIKKDHETGQVEKVPNRLSGNYYFIKNDDDVKFALSFPNGARGVLVILDEAHLYFGKKTGISLDVLTAISQQRKDRRRIVFTSQIWEELDISLRKQVKEIVSCRSIFRKIQINTVSDGESLSFDKLSSEYVAKKIRTEVFKHNDDLYNSYSTYQKIVTNKNYSRSYSPTFNTSTSVTVKK